MTTSFAGRHCEVCRADLTRRYFSLSKRCQWVLETENESVITVLSDHMLADFCSDLCRDEVESAIAATLQVAYQPFDMTASCSLCRAQVRRDAPHVAISVAEYEDISEPWLLSARILDEREIAVYCPGCADAAAGEVIDDVVDDETVDEIIEREMAAVG